MDARTPECGRRHPATPTTRFSASLPTVNNSTFDIVPRLRIIAVIGISSSNAAQMSGSFSISVGTISRGKVVPDQLRRLLRSDEARNRIAAAELVVRLSRLLAIDDPLVDRVEFPDPAAFGCVRRSKSRVRPAVALLVLDRLVDQILGRFVWYQSATARFSPRPHPRIASE